MHGNLLHWKGINLLYQTVLRDEHLQSSDKIFLLDTVRTYLTTAPEGRTDGSVPGQAR